MPDPSTYGMGGRASIDWSGPIEPLIQQIAQTAYYRVKIIGREPAVPILVTINAKNEMLGDILSNVAFQCGKRADVILYPENQVIELRYAEN
jgi:defect-in-organelle-trafficking protein DotD